MSRIRLFIAVLITVLVAALIATAGAQGSMAVAMQQATAAGLTAITANTTSNTLANNGNIGRGLKDTFNKDGTKSILASTLTAGATGGISDAAGIGMDAKTLKPVNTTDLANRAKYAAINTATKTAVDVAIQDKSFASAFTDNLRSNAGTQTQSALASAIGDAKMQGKISNLEHKSFHALAAAGSAAISGDDVGAAALAAPTSEALFDKLYLGGIDLETAADISKIAGSTTGLLTGDVDSASSSASTTIDNNAVPHVAAVTAACVVNPVCAGIVATATIAAGVAYYSMPQDEQNALAQRAAYYVQTQLNAGMDIEQIKNSIPGFASAPKLKTSLETPIHKERPKVLTTPVADQKSFTKLETPIYEQDQSEYLEGFTTAPDWLKNFGSVLLSEQPDWKNAVYVDAPYHKISKSGLKNPAPTAPQDNFLHSIQISPASKRRIAVDKIHNEIIVFDFTSATEVHGHIRSWKELDQDMKNILLTNQLVTKKGKIK